MASILNFLPWRRNRKEQDLDRELRDHVNRRVDDLMRSGLSEAEARRQATLEFGGIDEAKEEVRETWLWRWLDNGVRDLRHAGRMLWRTPWFTTTALLSLALGVGANAAIFSLIDQVLLRVLPVEEPERLVNLRWEGSSLSAGFGGGNRMSYPLCRDLQQQQLFDGVFCRYPVTVNFSTGQQHDPVAGEVVSGSYFSTLGVRPELGRLIEQSDDLQPGSHPVVVLSYNYWRTEFGGTKEVVGRKVLVNNYPMTVIGVAPRGFRGTDMLANPKLWVPAMMMPQIDSELGPRIFDRRTVWMNVFGRLKPAVTVAEAKAGLQPWFKAMLVADTHRAGFPTVTSEQYQRYLASTIDPLPAARGMSMRRTVLERPLLVLLGGTVLLLLLASLNVAGLLLARGAARSRELTTRMAIGATRGRITSQLLAETVLLTLGGGLFGLAVAPAVSQMLLAFLSPGNDLGSGIDYRVFLFAFGVTMLTGLLCSFASIFQASRIPLIASLKEKARVAAGGGVRLRKVLVVGQMAFTLLLLVGAGLFGQTLARLHSNVGFTSGSLVMFGIDPPAMGYSDVDSEKIMREVDRAVREMPGVESAAVANTRMLNGGWSDAGMTIQSNERFVTDRAVLYMRIGPGFFTTLGTPVIAGRDFEQRDVRPPGAATTSWRSVIVNESFARRYFKDRSPVGYRLGIGTGPNVNPSIEIIGVVKDFNRRNLRDEEVEHVFFPYWDRSTDNGTFYVKMRGNPDAAFSAIRALVRQVDPALPVGEPITFEEQIERSVWVERAVATLSSAFGLTALLLSVVGLYGVMSLVVTNRTQEIGVRMALGATRSDAVWLIVRDVLTMLAVGTAVALPSVWALRRLVQAQLFGISAVDGPTIAIASCFLALISLGAAILPAWRAASVNPIEALRVE